MSGQVDYDEELVRVWALVNELSEQLANNRALVTQLKARAENVKGQAVHVGAGFPLRRFNLDISDEEFQTELESFASHLVLENQTLQHENKQLNNLLKEYEQTLETVMGKFRGVAHASQQHDLSLHQYYSSLLQSLQTAHSSAQLHDDTSLSLLLTRLSTLLRSALRSLNGEESSELADAAAALTLEEAGGAIRTPSPLSSSPERSSPSRPGTSGGGGLVVRGPPRRHQFPGFIPGSSGGYFGTEGQGDWAMEREMEIQRLEEENRALREMLGIAEEISEGPVEPAAEEHHSPQPGPHQRPSLTVQELEASAMQEAAEAKERAEHPEEEKPEKPPVNESVLGFRANAEQQEVPENVFDETDGEVAPEPPAQ